MLLSVDVAVGSMMIVPRCFSFLARGASQGYAPQSGEIIGILEQLMAAQKEDEDRKANQARLVNLTHLARHTLCSLRST